MFLNGKSNWKLSSSSGRGIKLELLSSPSRKSLLKATRALRSPHRIMLPLSLYRSRIRCNSSKLAAEIPLLLASSVPSPLPLVGLLVVP